ncbi:MAG: hypothetical protein ABI609_14240 [Acidobacteriota bacterium]
MNHRRWSVVVAAAALSFAVSALPASASPKTEIKGAAILDHACGKVAVKQMGLLHDGKFDEANKMSTQAMQDEWKKMPAADQKMMQGMMKEMASTGEQFATDIKASGDLIVEGEGATLTVVQEHKDANGSSKSTMTQKYVIDAKGCWITH